MAPPQQHTARNLIIRSRFGGGESMQVIGADYGLTRQRIYQIITQPDDTALKAERAARNAAIRRDYSAGRPEEDMAAEHGITTRQIRRIVGDLITARNAARHREVRRLRAEGWAVADIAAKTGYHKMSIYYILNRRRY